MAFPVLSHLLFVRVKEYLPKVAGKRSVAAAATTATGVLTMWVTECGTLAGAQLNGVCSQLVHGMLLLTDLSRDSELLGGSRPIGKLFVTNQCHLVLRESFEGPLRLSLLTSMHVYFSLQSVSHDSI
eukprot:COSAG02_NODE_12392_length_1554_cov_1.261168_2_plen_127_part_00